MPPPYPAVELRRQRVLLAQTMTTRCLDRLALTNGFQLQTCTRNRQILHLQFLAYWIKSTKALRASGPERLCAQTSRLALRVHRC
jgi:hypothetical protein